MNDLTLDEKIALCRMDLDSPDLPKWAYAPRLQQLSQLLAERDRRIAHEIVDLERMVGLQDAPEEFYPHFTVLSTPSALDVAKSLIKRMLKR